ncbi:hypothetical protein PR003_g2898 [Phytophthora rubi]|uniref:DDE Tnp4 domain-containing protein n=1 Tax=Phytophthora rubi TaxID=129364 RepID=A0A6A4G564_9STRA|nr:hypothetical protein PR003_g2898 [Phytophthora rubi]
MLFPVLIEGVSELPKISDRQQVITQVIDLLALAVLEDELDEDADGSSPFDDWTECFPVESTVDELHEILLQLLSRRYMAARINKRRSHEFARQYFLNLHDDDFRQLTRTTRESFEFISNKIKDHRVFQNNSDHPQAPIWLQLAVALDRLGTNGNGSSMGRTTKIWGVGTGTLDLFTARVVIALSDMFDEYIKWPSSDERSQTARRMRREGFPGKHRSSLNGQVVCDDRRCIIALYSGWPGSCADSTVNREMALSKDGYKRQFFSEGQYLLADSAYPADKTYNTLDPAYKKYQAGTDNEAFNTCVAHVRVVNEHTIGVLKSRWSSLRELRVQIKIKEDIERVLRWINACVVLHNLPIEIADDWSSSGEESSSSDEDDLEWDDDDTFPFRGRLKAHAVTRGREEGGIEASRNEGFFTTHTESQ